MFNSARLKLTAWYLLIIMCVSFAFSLLIYRVLVNEVERFDREQHLRINRLFFDPIDTSQMVFDAESRIRLTLLIVDGTIFIVSGLLGYFLAGRTLQPIVEMVDEQNRFISDASHELKTPLTSLKSAFEVYLRDKNRAVKDADEIITDSISEVDKLKDLSESLLLLAQYEKPDGHSQLKKLNLKNIIDSSIHKIGPLAKQKNIEILPQLFDATILGNEYGLQDLFSILLDNAIKYSPENSKIDIAMTKAVRAIKVIIHDEGPGIKSGDLPHIFDRFYRADTARSSDSGYGLGLSIAKKIIETNHADISVQSKIGSGTSFTVSFQPWHINSKI